MFCISLTHMISVSIGAYIITLGGTKINQTLEKVKDEHAQTSDFRSVRNYNSITSAEHIHILLRKAGW